MRKILFTILIILGIAALGWGTYNFLGPKLNKENRQIEAWISANNLNQYGDPQNTVYSNDKPCNTTLACYDYIKKMHPDKPWGK